MSDYRTWLRLIETTDMVTPSFAKQVRQWANHIARDIADDLPKGAGFIAAIRQVLQMIDAEEPIGPKMLIYRAELRPADGLEAITDVGAHWCWDPNAARVYHHDNAYDYHQTEDLTKVLIEAEASFEAIDWPYTIATNLIHKAEHEMTVRNGAQVKILEIYAADRYMPINRVVPVYGDYRQ